LPSWWRAPGGAGAKYPQLRSPTRAAIITLPHFQALHLVPEQHALETVWQICDEMPEALLSNTSVQVEPFWCARIEVDDAALYGRLRYSEPLPGWSAEELPFRCNEVVVPEHERNVEEMLRDECPSAATWHQIVTVTAPMAAHEAFQSGACR
jgi:hypothetical protein